MAEKGIDAAGVAGSGRGGRVTKADVLEAGQRPSRPRGPGRAGAIPALSQPAAPVNVDASASAPSSACR
jgi:2-oxoglutarate dehydrogenase E2 component (dihydrolipoamide succinyltransferase)